MNFRNMVRKFVNWAQNQSDSDAAVQCSPYNTAVSGSSRLSDGGMNFTIYNAVGGKVIQCNTYNASLDKTRTSLYVIGEKEDLANELGQIITVESLSR